MSPFLPQGNDVLLGRGTPINSHIGNIKFRKIIKEYKESYLSARNNYEKYLIAMGVQQSVKNQCPPGRFMRYDSIGKTWVEATNEETKSKISQGLREKEKLSPMKMRKYKYAKIKTDGVRNNIGSSANIDPTPSETENTNNKNTKAYPSIKRKTYYDQNQNQHEFFQSCHGNVPPGENSKAVADSTSHEIGIVVDAQKHRGFCDEDNKDKFMVNLPSETVAGIVKPDEVINSNTKSNIELSIASFLIFLSKKK